MGDSCRDATRREGDGVNASQDSMKERMKANVATERRVDDTMIQCCSLPLLLLFYAVGAADTLNE